MKSTFKAKFSSAAALCLAVFGLLFFTSNTQAQGSLDAANADGKSLGACPLKRTDVKAEISGFLSRVRVRQEFENNFSEKIEAVYVFPLSNKAAVDEMTMQVGARSTVRGKILKREAAREVYENARSSGRVAALLDQERPNVFTQSVANILPGEKVTIEISYVETLAYDAGTYEFVFPTVVAPRYNPAQVVDAAKITPPIAAVRAGHDISIEVTLNSGVPVESIVSKSHQIETNSLSANSAVIRLKDADKIPNKDFVLRYDVSGKKISDAVLTHRDERGGFFTLILQPPDNPRTTDVTPKEIVFVLDTSGSMSGFPIEKAKEAMKLALDGMYPSDTFNLITFAGETAILFDEPVPATRENLKKAQDFLDGRKGGGGTEMMKAIKAALDPSDAQNHLRVVCFMTDGEVGNDNEIIAEVQKHPNARVFSFGIGSSINRHLLDKIAEEGRGEAEYVSLSDDGSAAAKRFHERVRAPLLTDLSIDWNGLPIADVYPSRVADLFSAKPVIIHGRYTGAANGVIKLKGKVAGREIVREIPVTLPENEAAHDTLAALWARSRIDDLTKQDYENKKDGVTEQITNLGLEFRLLTAFTSFVAVEEFVVTDNGQPRRIDVPVEQPEGTTNRGNLEDRDSPFRKLEILSSLQQPPPAGFSASDDPHGYIVQGLVGRRNNKRRSVPAKPNASPTVNSVTLSANTAVVDVTESKIQTNVSAGGVEALPKSVAFSSLLQVSPNTRSDSAGGFQIDGTSGGENTFLIDGQEVTNFRTGTLNKINAAGSGAAISLPKPVSPTPSNVSGDVNVQIVIDEKGSVEFATATSGHPLLRVASVQAARQAKFNPTQLYGKAVKLSGVIVYNFSSDAKNPSVTTALKNFALKLSPEERNNFELRSKTSPMIFALVMRLKNADAAAQTPDEAQFVKNGKAEIRVSFSDKTPAAIVELQNAGFEIVLNPATAKFVIGRIPLDKLAALAGLKAVTFIAPQMQTN